MNIIMEDETNKLNPPKKEKISPEQTKTKIKPAGSYFFRNKYFYIKKKNHLC